MCIDGIEQDVLIRLSSKNSHESELLRAVSWQKGGNSGVEVEVKMVCKGTKTNGNLSVSMTQANLVERN